MIMDVVFPQGNKMKDLLYDEDDDTDCKHDL